MKVRDRRWGEVTIKRQGRTKNKFVQTRSFSIDRTENGYTLEQYLEILKLVTESTRTISFTKLKGDLRNLVYGSLDGG